GLVLHHQGTSDLKPDRLHGVACGQRVVQVERAVGGDVQLVAELPEVGDASAGHRDAGHLDLAAAAERPGVGREVGIGEGGEDVARQRPLQVELAEVAGDVLDPYVAPPGR